MAGDLIAKKETIFLNGEFLGWEVTTPERWEEVRLIGGKSYMVKVQEYGKVFIPKDHPYG